MTSERCRRISSAHAFARAGRRAEARTVEVDDPDLAARIARAEEQVAEVQIRVARARVVERAHGAAGGGRSAPARRRRRRAREQREAIERAFLVDGSHRGALEAAHAPRRDEHRNRNRSAERAQPRVRVQLGERPREADQPVAQQTAQQAAVVDRSQVQPLGASRQRHERGARSPARARSLGQRALEPARLEQAERQRSALELGET